MTRLSTQRGFTLLEVVTAVLILSISMTALIAWATESADRTGLLREKAIANWVAHNKLTELHLAETWPDVGKSNGESEMTGQIWLWRIEIQETPDERIRRADVYVDSPNGRGQLVFVSGFLPPAPLGSGGAVQFSARTGPETINDGDDPNDQDEDLPPPAGSDGPLIDPVTDPSTAPDAGS